MSAPPFHLLLVEDDEIDVLTIRRALAAAACELPLHIANNAEQALALLRGGTSPGGERRRWLVLLDLNLPGMSGLELMRRVRGEPPIAGTTVVVMTTSADERDVRTAYGLHAVGYFIKPLDPMRLSAMLRAITAYWAASAMP